MLGIKNNKIMKKVKIAYPTTFRNLSYRIFLANILMILCLSLTILGQTQTINNSVGMEFVYIPAGTFEMGATDDSESSPVHRVTISSGFYLGKYEVTQEEYKKVTGTNPSYFENCPRCPVEMVSWNDARDFIEKLNAKGDGTYRLPTEAEWEYSEQAGTRAVSPRAIETGWYRSNSEGKTHEVGTKQPNAWGLYDMNGNVTEWVADRFGGYPNESVTDPLGPLTGSDRVFRGGHFEDDIEMMLEGRIYADPSLAIEKIGFRVVRTLAPVKAPTATEFKIYLLAAREDVKKGVPSDRDEVCRSLIAISRTKETTDVLKTALEELIKTPDGIDGGGIKLDNAWHGSLDYILKSVTLADGIATIRITGRVVSAPCFETELRAQIEATAKQFPAVKKIKLSFNGRSNYEN